MDARSQTLLSKCPHYSGWQQERYQKRPQHTKRAQKKQTGTSQIARGPGDGRTNPRLCLHRVLGENELADIAYLAEHYEKTVLILNIANLVDTTELKKIKGLKVLKCG